MKAKIVPIVGDVKENLYQLGLAEKESFAKLEDRVLKLLSTSSIIRQGQDILNRARAMFKKKKDEEKNFFDTCLEAYAEGLGIDLPRYQSFLSLFELAAHYGQAFPELKGLLPGCTSLFTKEGDQFEHSRLIDFPLIGVFDLTPRLYLWQIEGKPTVLNYSCEGLAPVFFQTIHECGMSVAIHHKPGKSYHAEGSNIFQIAFELMFESRSFADFRKELKNKSSITKWSLLLLEKSGKVEVYDIDGPTLNLESYHLNESAPLIFTNIPLKADDDSSAGFVSFCHQRQSWLKLKLAKKSQAHILDQLTDVQDQKVLKWLHPAATLSTTGALTINLTRGHIDIKHGVAALVASDGIIRFSLADQRQVEELKAPSAASEFERAWKRASKAQSAFDQGDYDEAYHQLQMAQVQIPHDVWKQIFDFYICVWDFKFVSNPKELNHVYKKLKKLHLPLVMKDQVSFLCMRLEKKLGLQSTVSVKDVSPHLVDHFIQEKAANKALFLTWMKLLYPRLEILDVFSPHQR